MKTQAEIVRDDVANSRTANWMIHYQMQDFYFIEKRLEFIGI